MPTEKTHLIKDPRKLMSVTTAARKAIGTLIKFFENPEDLWEFIFFNGKSDVFDECF